MKAHPSAKLGLRGEGPRADSGLLQTEDFTNTQPREHMTRAPRQALEAQAS